MRDRLQLLQDANVITVQSAEICNKVSKLIATRLNITSDNMHFQMAITHLSRAFDRIKNGAAIDKGMDTEMFIEIITDPSFPFIDKLNSDILNIMNITVPSTENSFFLCNLMSLYYAQTENA